MVYTGVDESGYTTAMLSIRKCLKGIQLTVKFKAYLFQIFRSNCRSEGIVEASNQLLLQNCPKTEQPKKYVKSVLLSQNSDCFVVSGSRVSSCRLETCRLAPLTGFEPVLPP